MTAWDCLGLAGLLGVGLACAPRATSPPPVARIAVAAEGDMWTLTALHTGPAGPETEYALTVDRVGTAGRSRSSQSGRFTPRGVAADTLSAVRVNVRPGDLVSASLTLRRGGAVVATDTLAQTAGPAADGPPAP